jgi:anti-anti-sigma factor
VGLPLKIQVTDNRSFSKTVHLDGKLNNETVAALDDELDKIAASPVTVLVFDLKGLDYISSAGLRSIFRIQKVMAARAGRTVLVNPQPPVQKVLDIVKAVDVAAVFASLEELDAYLDLMQRRIVDGERAAE